MRKLITLTTLALVAVLVATPAAAQQCTAEANAIFEAMATVAALDVPIENALLTELAAAMVGVASGDTEAAIADLEAFIKKVAAQSGKQIDAATAAELIALARQIIAGAQCPCTDFWNEWVAFVNGLTNGDVQAVTPLLDPNPLIAVFSFEFPVFPFRAFGVQFDVFGAGALTGFVCGGDTVTTPLPDIFLIPLNTQEELDGCRTVMEGFYGDFGCPAEGGSCGGAGPVGASPSQFGSTPFTGGAR